MNENQRALRDEPTGKLLLKFSLPAVFAMLLNSVYNIIDKLFIGNQADIINASGDVLHVGTLSLAGLNIAFPIQMLIIAIATMIGLGASSLISRYLGAQEYNKTDKTFGNAIFLIVIFSAFISIFGLLFSKPILIIFGATDAILPYSQAYLNVILYGTVFFSLTVSLNNIVRAEGNALMAMIVMIVGIIINIPLDYFFVLVFNWGVAGAAWATIISQLIGFIIILFYFFSKKSYFKFKLSTMIPNKKIISDILVIGLPSLVRTGAFTLFSIVINNAIKQYGIDAHFAIMGVLSPVLSFIMMPSTGITQGMQPIVGYNYGAKKIERVHSTLYKSIFWASFISILGFSLLYIYTGPIIGAFIKEKQTVDLGVSVFKIILLGIPTIGFQVVIGGYFQSIGKAIPSLVVTSARQVLFLVPLVLILSPLYGIHGVWISFPIADYAALILSLLWMHVEMQKEKKIFAK